MDLDRLDLEKLRVFYLVARHGGLSRAASQLQVTVSAISFSIRRLEEQLGIQLFNRMPNRLVLTPAGGRLLGFAEAIFAGIDKVLADSALEEVHTGRLSVCVNSDLAWYFVPKISAFLQRYPDIELSVSIKSSAEALGSVDAGEIDLAIGRFLGVPATMEVAPIVESTMALVCPRDHPLVQRKIVRLADIARFKLVSAGHSTKETIDVAFAKVGISTRGHIEAGNCQTAREFVAAGIGLGLIHAFCTRRPSTDRLHIRDLSRHLGTRTFSALYRKQPGTRPTLFKQLRDALLADDGRPTKRAKS